MGENTVRIHGYDIPVEKVAEAEEMVLGWSDEEEANRDEPCICFFSKTYHTGWRVVEGGDAGSMAEVDSCIGLADALEAWRKNGIGGY